MFLFIMMLVLVGVSVGLAWYLIACDKGEKEPIGALWLAAGFGLVGGFIAGYLNGFLPSPEELKTITSQGTLLSTALAVGFIEESCKFVPFTLFIYKKRYFNEHTDGVIYFALVGLGFGLPENLIYTMIYGAETGIARLFMTPFFHAAITGMVGYYLAKRKLNHRPFIGIILPLIGAILLHGFYDYGLMSGNPLLVLVSLLITICLSAGLFLLFLRAKQRDQDRGLSVVGHNAFCRSCGFANPEHKLYCVHCGKNA